MTGGAGRARAVVAALLAVQTAVATTVMIWWLGGIVGGGSPLPVGAPPGPGPTGIETALRIAEPVAQAWREDAWIAGASMQVDWPWDDTSDSGVVPGGGWVNAVFAGGAGSDPGTLSVLVERGGGVVVRTESLGWDSAPPGSTALVTTYPWSSNGAVIAGEEAGGREFRRACPAARHLTRVSLVAQPDGQQTAPPVWLVTYHDVRQPERNALEFRVDAVSGDVLTTQDRSLPCAEEAEAEDAEEDGDGREEEQG